MARRKDSPQKAAMREMMRDYLKNNDISIKDGTDVNSIMRDMMSVILESALDEELDEELGYSNFHQHLPSQMNTHILFARPQKTFSYHNLTHIILLPHNEYISNTNKSTL